MAVSTRSIDVLLRDVADPVLRAKLQESVDILRKQTQFGLVFEGHQPEVSRLYDYPIRPGSLVARRADKGNEVLRVLSIKGDIAECLSAATDEPSDSDLLRIPLRKLVVCRRFGDPIYPSLTAVDFVENGSDKPWNILIEADNYHALQLLEYTHEGKVDIIYIDPPYNTGASDWKYNNDYVDGKDPWRHSKWLSFMEKRLILARRLLCNDGVIVVTIDEHEIHHLVCLLEQLFNDAYIQMVTIVVNPKGVTQGRFSRVEEYAVFCFFGGATVVGKGDDLLSIGKPSAKRANGVRWKGLLRSGTNARRQDRKNMFYPIVVDPAKNAVIRACEALPYEQEPDLEMTVEGYPVAWPIRSDGTLGNWGLGSSTFNALLKKGYVRLGDFDSKRRTWGFTYLSRKLQQQIETGAIVIRSFDEVRNCVTVEYTEEKQRQIKTVWHRSAHDAGAYGSDLLRHIFGEAGKFPFPKSLYAVRDTLASLVRHKKNAVVLDFFGGSGTTLHALALLNAADGGRRQAIIVTNNEVSKEESQKLRGASLEPGDREWESQGICQAVTWPRIKASLTGRRPDGTLLSDFYVTGEVSEREIKPDVKQIGLAEGSELTLPERRELAKLLGDFSPASVEANQPFLVDDGKGQTILWDIDKAAEWFEAIEDCDGIRTAHVITRDKKRFRQIAQRAADEFPRLIVEEEIKRPMSEGFKENAAYFRLGFLDPDAVNRGEAFSGILPVLWMYSGGSANLPQVRQGEDWIISIENNLSILLSEDSFQEFLPLVRQANVKNIFLVTDSADSFKEMHAQVPQDSNVSMLYSSFLKNFRINAARVS
ncbi:site-specific DNA-methyltransferase [Sinorhizobium meliloti]|uniref:site-specific DNA-methyltransferase n=1 Tax=Rhizobium meliloti TaxID=382 RepID=UPI000FD9EF86|nr:DNA methyltransferase [Sinorhizobium meliloti]MDW9638485.1 site-specific DNA-methyltransferase [Sinorhizobium meliloti]MDX0283602.1 site-specific DNA-methyltransferase [Sinorhizobium meliloti]RVH78042.1 site-specific DNA-methyltransferase [Sinorhizobium meliloti]RVK71631.1 site-specific DNA-methyltransferase [Sinorhizobium meliloti]RVL30198.1 site-specific DNA-methyltransferase [Sinorhizobium meliloti]